MQKQHGQIKIIKNIERRIVKSYFCLKQKSPKFKTLYKSFLWPKKKRKKEKVHGSYLKKIMLLRFLLEVVLCSQVFYWKQGCRKNGQVTHPVLPWEESFRIIFSEVHIPPTLCSYRRMWLKGASLCRNIPLTF